MASSSRRRLLAKSDFGTKNHERLSNDVLFDLYVKQRWSIHRIARETGYSRRSIARWIRQSESITLRTSEETIELFRKRPLPDKQALYEMYWTKGSSTKQIGQSLGLCDSWVRRLVERYGIPRRTLSESGIEYPKHPFSGSSQERAYLMGLRAGDLNSVITGTQVRIGTSTTHPAMRELVLACFGKNGRVNKTPARNKFGFEWAIYAYLDSSLKFLLKKSPSIEDEIRKDESLFLAFLSGYIDAEGNLRIYAEDQFSAVSLRINSEDEGILRGIRDALRTMGYHVYFGLEKPKGIHQEKVLHKNVWSLGMFRKAEVINLVTKLTLRHSEKKEWARLLVGSEGKSWDDVRQAVTNHREQIKKDVMEFCRDAQIQYVAKHQLVPASKN